MPDVVIFDGVGPVVRLETPKVLDLRSEHVIGWRIGGTTHFHPDGRVTHHGGVGGTFDRSDDADTP